MMRQALSSIAIGFLVVLAGCGKQKSAVVIAQELCNQASVAMQKDNHANAASLLRQATATNPDFAEAWVGLGMALIQMNQTNEARSAYERALVLHSARYANDQSPNELQQQTFVLLLLCRDDEATALVNYGMDAHSDNPDFMRFADEFPKLVKSGFPVLAVGY